MLLLCFKLAPAPCGLVPFLDRRLAGAIGRERLEHCPGDDLIGVHLAGGLPEAFALRLARSHFEIAQDQVGLQRLGAPGKDLAAGGDRLIFLPIAPERFGQRDHRIEAVGLVGNYLAELGDRLGQHMAFGVQPGQAGAAEAQLRVFAAPRIGIEPQELIAQLGHIGLDLKRLLEFGDRPVEPALALVGDAQPNVGRDVLGIRAQDALEGLLSAVKLTVGEIGLAKDPIGLQVLGIPFEDVLGQADRPLQIVAFEPLPGLVVCRLQAHACHLGPPLPAPRRR